MQFFGKILEKTLILLNKQNFKKKTEHAEEVKCHAKGITKALRTKDSKFLNFMSFWNKYNTWKYRKP